MLAYNLDQKVFGTVIKIFHWGVFVLTEDNVEAYIKRRNLDVEPRINPFESVQIGDQIEAVVIKLPTKHQLLELDRKAVLPDPWKQFQKDYKVDDIVQGQVSSIHRDGMFVNLRQGISGFLPYSDLEKFLKKGAFFRLQNYSKIKNQEKLFWTGDWIEATIEVLNVKQKRIELSIFKRLQQRKKSAGLISKLLLHLASKSPDDDEEAPSELSEIETLDDLNVLIPAPILIVEDHDESCERLTKFFKSFGIMTMVADNIEEARTILREDQFWLMILDLEVHGEDGLELAYDSNRPPYLFIHSDFGEIMRRAAEIEAAKVTNVYAKQIRLATLLARIAEIAENPDQLYWKLQDNQNFFQDNLFQHLVRITAQSLPPAERMQQILVEIQNLLELSAICLFEYQRDGTYSILAASGLIDNGHDALERLQYSPVKDIIQEQITITDTRISPNNEKHRNLLQLFSYQSCVGLPIHVQSSVRHAIFFFHRSPNAFSENGFFVTSATAIMLSALLEQQIFQERLQSIGIGLINADLTRMHDVSNLVGSVKNNLKDILKEEYTNPEAVQHDIEYVRDEIEILDKITKLFSHHKFSETHELMPVDKIIDQAIMVVNPAVIDYRGGSKKVEIIPPSGPSDAMVLSEHAEYLRQILVNLMINAIDMVMSSANLPIEDDYRTRSIEISTRDEDLHTFITIRDSGPGIHYRMWEEVFYPGVSTKEGGSGLGLTIVRTLLSHIGGEIQIKDSFILVGTTFSIRLPKQVIF